MITSNFRTAFLSKSASSLPVYSKQATNGRLLLQRLGKVVGGCVLLAASLACTVFPSHAAVPERIPVANHTGFTDEELGKYLAENLNQNLKDEIVKRNLAVFALTATFSGQRACFATVGLTAAAPANRNARHPQRSYRYWRHASEKSWDTKIECGSKSIVEAITSLNSAPIEEALEEIEWTNSDGGTRPIEHLARETVSLSSSGVDETKDLFAEIHAHKFSAAFDYRHVQTSVYAFGTQFDGGEYMCVAFAGLTAKAPDGRNIRWPAATTGYVEIQTGGTLEGCKGIAAKQAIHHHLEKPWTADGLLKSFALTREDGIPLPDASKVAKAKAGIEKPIQPKSVQVASKTTSINRTYCENICRNGDCIRSFPGGRKERWQAPRVYNAMNSNWEWDTSTNACGA